MFGVTPLYDTSTIPPPTFCLPHAFALSCQLTFIKKNSEINPQYEWNIVFRKEYEKTDDYHCGGLIILLSRMEEEGPLTAMDFFTVDKSTLCSIVGTVLTYLLILVQYPQ